LIRKNTLVATLFVIGASATSVAQADAPTHFAPTELGIVYHHDAARQRLSRAQVSAELALARQQPGWDVASRIGERPAAAVGARSRAEVLAELSAAQRHPGWDNAARTGFPLAAGAMADSQQSIRR